MEIAKISNDKQELMLKCFRWGVCEDGSSRRFFHSTEEKGLRLGIN
jgi:hypothetical protein